jgi:hypothetical protein
MDEETQETPHSTTEHFTDNMNNQDVGPASHVQKLHNFFFLYGLTDQCGRSPPIFWVSKYSL